MKQFSKQVGDYVEQDEEIATIETDKIDVSVNAPEAGTIKEWLVNEEDTVTVGQDLVNIDVGAAPEGGASKEAKDEPKEPASKDQQTASQPEGQQEKEAPAGRLINSLSLDCTPQLHFDIDNFLAV